MLSLQCLVYLAERKPALWCNDLRAEHSSTERAFSLQNVLRARAQRRQVRGEQGGKGASRWDSSAVEVAPGTDARVRDDGRPVGGVGGGGEGASDDGNSDFQPDVWLADEYPIAVSGINITSILCALLQIGDPPDTLEPQAWWPLVGSQEAFFELYCAAFRLLDAQWHSGTADSRKLGAVLEGTRALETSGLADVALMRRELLRALGHRTDVEPS